MIGTWITLRDPAVSEALSLVGFDWICVDRQHSMMSDEDMQNHLRNIKTTSFVRLAKNTTENIGKALDAGADGIIVPQVMTRADAYSAVMATVPPTRSTGLWQSRHYGMDGAGTKFARVILQIEHIDAVNMIDEIVSVPGVTGFIVGPYDLSASLGAPGDFDSHAYISAMDSVDSFVQQYDGLAGLHIPVLDDVRKLFEAKLKGYEFLGVGMDTTFMWGYAAIMLAEMRQI